MDLRLRFRLVKTGMSAATPTREPHLKRFTPGLHTLECGSLLPLLSAELAPSEESGSKLPHVFSPVRGGGV